MRARLRFVSLVGSAALFLGALGLCFLAPRRGTPDVVPMAVTGAYVLLMLVVLLGTSNAERPDRQG